MEQRSVRSRQPIPTVFRFASIAFTIVVFAPFLFSGRVPVRLVVIVLGLLMVSGCQRNIFRADHSPIGPHILWILAPMGLIATALMRGPDDAPDLAMNLERFCIVAPILFVAGRSIVRSGSWTWFARMYSGIALVMAVGALLEYVLQRSLFGRSELYDYLARGDGGRSILASDHPLVLAMLLASAVPLVLAFEGSRWHVAAQTVLIVGIFSTGSRGPLILAVFMAVVLFLARRQQWRSGLSRSAKLVGVAGLACLAYLASFQWSSEIQGASGYDYSTGYRTALYSLLPTILRNETFGVGLGEIPVGLYTIDSSFLGSQDLTRTVDSELVYLVLQLGIFGLILFLWSLWLGVHALRWDLTAGAVSTCLTIGGLFVAIHAWDTLGPLWFLILGACWAFAHPADSRGPALVATRGVWANA